MFRVVCNQYDKSYEDLQPNNNASTYQKQSQHLAFQIFKSLMRLNAEFMWFCDCKNPIPCILKKNPNFFYHQLRDFASGIILYTSKESFHGVISLFSVKNSQALNEFKLKLRIWETFTVHPPCIVETYSFKFLPFRYVCFPSIYLIMVKFSVG